MDGLRATITAGCWHFYEKMTALKLVSCALLTNRNTACAETLQFKKRFRIALALFGFARRDVSFWMLCARVWDRNPATSNDRRIAIQKRHRGEQTKQRQRDPKAFLELQSSSAQAGVTVCVEQCATHGNFSAGHFS